MLDAGGCLNHHRSCTTRRAPTLAAFRGFSQESEPEPRQRLGNSVGTRLRQTRPFEDAGNLFLFFLADALTSGRSDLKLLVSLWDMSK